MLNAVVMETIQILFQFSYNIVYCMINLAVKLSEMYLRFDASLIWHKDHSYPTVHNYFSEYDPITPKNHMWSLYDYEQIIYDPGTSTKNHSSFSFSISAFNFIDKSSLRWFPGITL